MKNGIYSIYDAKAEVFTSPMSLMNNNVAVRIFQNCVNTPEHNYALNPEDYNLFKLGEFDDNTGLIDVYNPPQILVSAISLKKNVHKYAQVNETL